MFPCGLVVPGRTGGSATLPFTSVAALPYYRDIYMIWVNGKF